MNLYENEDTFVPDSLFAGHEIPVLVKGITLAPTTSGKYARGSIVMVAADGTAKLLDKTKLSSKFSIADTVVTETKGSSIAGILTDDVVVPTEETATTTKASVYICGYFHKNALICADGTAVTDIELELRKMNIFID